MRDRLPHDTGNLLTDAPRRIADILLPRDSDVISAVVPNGATVAGMLGRHLLPESELSALVQAVTSSFDARRLRAGNIYRVERLFDGRIRSFEYRDRSDAGAARQPPRRRHRPVHRRGRRAAAHQRPAWSCRAASTVTPARSAKRSSRPASGSTWRWPWPRCSAARSTSTATCSPATRSVSWSRSRSATTASSSATARCRRPSSSTTAGPSRRCGSRPATTARRPTTTPRAAHCSGSS